jgi:hypothetical protein
MGGLPMGGMPPVPPASAGGAQSPAGIIAPQVQALATQQDQELAAMQQQMKDQVTKLLTMLPTYNPAGAAAITSPLPMATSPDAPQQDTGMPNAGVQDQGAMY